MIDNIGFDVVIRDIYLVLVMKYELVPAYMLKPTNQQRDEQNTIFIVRIFCNLRMWHKCYNSYRSQAYLHSMIIFEYKKATESIQN